ncbi:MAG: hypothetical protein HN700_07285 [Verrucomicrobia bacterium]|jgi:hypothetical protein|nr:hypothetical protein [Verrucomicrobiota bacterium]
MMRILLKHAAVVLLGCLMAGCFELDGTLMLRDDGSAQARFEATSPWCDPAAVSNGLPGWIEQALEESTWQRSPIRGERDWQGIALTNAWSADEASRWLTTDQGREFLERLVLSHKESDLYELRLDMTEEQGISFRGAAAPPPTMQDSKGSFDPSTISTDLAILALRGVKCSLALELPGKVADTSFRRVGSNAVGLSLDGNALIRDYFAATVNTPRDARSDALGEVAGQHLVTPTNAWVTFEWPGGPPRHLLAVDAAPARTPSPVRDVVLSAPPQPRVVAREKLGDLHVASARLRVERSQRKPNRSTTCTWSLHLDQEGDLKQRLSPVHVGDVTMDPTVTTPAFPGLDGKWDVKGSGLLRLVATYRTESDELPNRLDAFAGRCRIVMTDRPVRVTTLQPDKEALYALQWDSGGRPQLEHIMDTPGSLTIVAHRNTRAYLAGREHAAFRPGDAAWTLKTESSQRTLRLVRKSADTPHPLLRLHKRLFVCDYAFRIEDVPFP